MSRDTSQLPPIALLATGDEIVQGDILNTNCQQIALRLMDRHIAIGTHLTVGDNIADIERAIVFLLQNHCGLIITGGLGPTSDDLTRYALSNVINQPLIFDEPTWEAICQRLKQFGYGTPPENNRQQALFPQGADIIPNPNGTAAGCQVTFNHHAIFMLPGPPNECLSMVDTVVLPALLEQGYQQPVFREKWLLFGASEGKIAEELDAIAKPFNCVTGYRLCYPYLEFKIYSDNQVHFETVIPSIMKTIHPYLIGNGQLSASDQLKNHLENDTGILKICDHVTGGSLESILHTPRTHPHLFFSAEMTDVDLKISGLEEFWQGKQTYHQTHIQLAFRDQIVEAIIPFRGDRVRLYAVEWICQQILKIMKLN